MLQANKVHVGKRACAIKNNARETAMRQDTWLWLILTQWFSTFQRLRPFGTVLQAAVTPTVQLFPCYLIPVILLLLCIVM